MATFGHRAFQKPQQRSVLKPKPSHSSPVASGTKKITSFVAQEGLLTSGLGESRIYKALIACVIMPCKCIFFKQKLRGLHCAIRQRGQVPRGNVILFGPAESVTISIVEVIYW